MQSPLSRAFTLLELLVVLLIAGVAYGLFFDGALFRSLLHGDGSQTFRLEKALDYFRALPDYGRSRYTLYALADGTTLLVDDKGQIRKGPDIAEKWREFVLMPDGTLLPRAYGHIRIGTREFAPLWRLVCRPDGRLDPLFLQGEKRWLYLHPFLGGRFFENGEAMARFVQKSDYLPDRAGYAQ